LCRRCTDPMVHALSWRPATCGSSIGRLFVWHDEPRPRPARAGPPARPEILDRSSPRSAGMSVRRISALTVERLESRDVPSQVPLLLPDADLAALRQKAAANTSQWQAFKTRLDQNLPVIVSLSSYQGSDLSWIADYSLGYEVLKTTDPVTAAKYADKAIAL